MGVSLGALVIVLASTVVLLGECGSLVPPSVLDPFRTLSPPSAHTAASLSCFLLQFSSYLLRSAHGSGGSHGTRVCCMGYKRTFGTTSLTTMSKGVGKRIR